MANKGGRPRKEIDWLEFEKLCSLHCTLIEIAEWFDCSEDTIERAVKRHYGDGFAEIFKRKSSKGKISLRRKLFEMAQAGNLGAAIWLSKQHLGMTDKVEQRQEISGGLKQEIVYTTEWGSKIESDTDKDS